MLRTNSRMLWALASAVISAGLLAAATPAQAYNDFLKKWSTLYPASTTDQAGCTTCHGSNSSALNAYGKDLCLQLQGVIPTDVTTFLQAIEGVDSDQDSPSTSNLSEINANAQPGWTAANNKLFYTWTGGCLETGATVAPPTNVPLPYDPPVAGFPVAVPGGPYMGLVNVPIVFDGSGSYDSDGNIVAYAWSFGDGGAGDQVVEAHTYAEAGTYTVTLTVIDNDGKSNTHQTTATVSSVSALDLDIVGLSVTKSVRVGKPISIKLSVANNGSVMGQAIATVEGAMDGNVVYSWRLNVFDDLGGGSTTFTFPAYTPSVKGTLNWSVSIADGDPDTDLASAVTVVK